LGVAAQEAQLEEIRYLALLHLMVVVMVAVGQARKLGQTAVLVGVVEL
jgi:hypothetical protein